MMQYDVHRLALMTDPKLHDFHQRVCSDPTNPRWHFELGSKAIEVENWHLAAECFLQVTKLAPQVDSGHFNLGNACFELRQFPEALKAYRSAFELKPDSGTLNNLGNVFAECGDWEQAVSTFDQALAHATCTVDEARLAYRNRGKALMATGNWTATIENYQLAFQRFPRDISFLSVKSRCHQQIFEYGQAMECLIEAIAISPNHPGILNQIADVNFARGRITEALLCLDRTFSIKQPSSADHSQWLKMLTHYPPVSAQRLLDEAKRWGTLTTQNLNAKPMNDDLSGENKKKTPDRPLRVGILTNDLDAKGTGGWLKSVISHCDRSRIDWWVYSDQDLSDETTQRVRHSVEHFTITTPLNDVALSALIKANQIDLLIDMIGHGRNTRLKVVAMRSAPVQISWAGFPVTSGLSQMDYLFSDESTLPTELESFVSEKVIRFPSTSLCFTVPEHKTEMEPCTETSDRPFLCGSLALPEMLSDELIETWAAILARIADAELLLIGRAYGDIAIQQDLRNRFERSGILPNRIRFHSLSKPISELEAIRQLDVMLDPFPVNSVQAAFESLWLGVPVVSKSDERISGRAVSSILRCIQRDAWTASTTEGYVQAAVRIAVARHDLRTQRNQLRMQLLASPMCDLETTANHVQNMLCMLALCPNENKSEIE